MNSNKYFNSAYHCIGFLYSLMILLAWYVLFSSARLLSATEFSFEADIRPDEIAIMQFDSRLPGKYWEVSAKWNNRYCNAHSHKYLYYSSKEKCRYQSVSLADPWCKVLSMLQSTADHPKIKAFVYMDSDAVIDKSFFNMSLNAMLETVRTRLDWDVVEKPVLFNQDGPCWWCNLIEKAGYKTCLNAGTVVWMRHPTSAEVLQSKHIVCLIDFVESLKTHIWDCVLEWWDSTQDSYETNPLKRYEFCIMNKSLLSSFLCVLRKFRTSWPWEQDRQMAIYRANVDSIQISSQPRNPFMQRVPGSQLISGGWCLSHLPRSGCFISHFCANQQSKTVMELKYTKFLGAEEYQLR